MTLAQLKVSLALWTKRLTSCRAALARARREAASGAGDAKAGVITTAEAARIRRWRTNVAEAERNVNLRRDQIAAKQPKPSSRGKAVAAVAWMTARVGTREQPPGSNRGPSIDRMQRRFGFLGAAWCGLAVGNALVAAGVRGVTSRIASVALILEDGRAGRNGMKNVVYRRRTGTGSVTAGQPGDLVGLFGEGTHVGMIVKRIAGGYENAEGNTGSGSAGSQSNGGMLARRQRPDSAVVYIVRPRYL